MTTEPRARRAELTARPDPDIDLAAGALAAFAAWQVRLLIDDLSRRGS